MKQIFHLLLILLFLSFSKPLFAQMSTSDVDTLVHYAMQKFNVAGVAVGIVKDGKVMHRKGYGIKSVKTKTAVDEHTNFAIASLSKAFTCTALALLVEEGKLNWTDKVRDHIPEFQMYNPYVTENFNIQDLLTHRSGMGLGIGDLMFFPDGADFTMEDLLASFQHFEAVSAFRTQFDYDNLLYLVAGELISRVVDMSWEDFIQQRIFRPLQMDQSFTSLDRIKDKSNLAAPHNSETGELVVLPDFQEMINGAAGGIYSNVDDLCEWMLVHLNEGTYGSELEDTLFNKASQREMWKIHTTLEPSTNPRYNMHFSGYGLGWVLSDQLGNMVVHHTGGLPGMLCKTVLVPDLKLGVVVLTNTSEDGAGVFGAVCQTIVDSYFGLDDYAWVDKYGAYFQEKRMEGDSVIQAVWEIVENADQESIREEDYLGMYEDPWFGKMEVFRKAGQLWLKAHRSPKLNGPLRYYRANTFAVKWEYQDMNADAFVMFRLDEKGKAEGIRMKGISPNIDFSFDFHDLKLERVD